MPLIVKGSIPTERTMSCLDTLSDKDSVDIEKMRKSCRSIVTVLQEIVNDEAGGSTSAMHELFLGPKPIVLSQDVIWITNQISRENLVKLYHMSEEETRRVLELDFTFEELLYHAVEIKRIHHKVVARLLFKYDNEFSYDRGYDGEIGYKSKWAVDYFSRNEEFANLSLDFLNILKKEFFLEILNSCQVSVKKYYGHEELIKIKKILDELWEYYEIQVQLIMNNEELGDEYFRLKAFEERVFVRVQEDDSYLARINAAYNATELSDRLNISEYLTSYFSKRLELSLIC